MIQYQLKANEVSVVAQLNTTMAELAMSLNFAFQWFLGRGVHRVRMIRLFDQRDHHFELTLFAQIAPKALYHSPAATIKEMVGTGYFPSSIPEAQQFNTGDKARDGQNRVDTSDSGTVTRNVGEYGTMSLFTMAYTAADQAVWSLCMGASAFEWHGSVTMLEQWMNMGLTPEAARQLSNPRYRAYEPERKLETLK